jgi:NMDA receptor-regulated protein 1
VLWQDPRGEKLLRTEDPLAEADKLLGTLKEHAAQRALTHEAAFEIALLQDKPFLAVHAVKQAAHLARDSPACHCMLVRLVKWLAERRRTVEPDVAAAVLDEEVSALTGAAQRSFLQICVGQRLRSDKACPCSHQ